MLIDKLHYITQAVEGKSHAELTELACQGGVRWVQFRAKNLGFDEWKKEALAVQEVCKKYHAALLINDNVKVAEEINANGVHLGKNDMDADKARKILGDDFIIGGTANSYEDILRLAEWKVDYIGLGPFRFTTTKENLSPTLGIDGYFGILQAMREDRINIPVIAIGGITLEDVDELMTIGAHGVAVSGAISKAKDVKGVASAFISSVI